MAENTGFDAPCLSTLFMDRQPMKPHDIVQALSRTNRLFDKQKKYGQIVTFQAPKQFKEEVDNAIKLFSAGGIGEALAGDWDETEGKFIAALADLRAIAPKPDVVPGLSKKEKKFFAICFQRFDSLLAQLRAFTVFEGKRIDDYGITGREYEDYAAHYKNVLEELRDQDDPGPEGGDEPPVNTDYEPQAFSKVKIDYEYIVSLIQDIVSSMDEDEDEDDFRKKIEEIRGYILDFSEGNEKLGQMMMKILNDIEKDKNAFVGKNISEILSDMKRDAIEVVVEEFVGEWHVDRTAVIYAIEHNNNGAIPNASVLKDSLNYAEYKETASDPLPKFKARSRMLAYLEHIIETEILPLQIGVNY